MLSAAIGAAISMVTQACGPSVGTGSPTVDAGPAGPVATPVTPSASQAIEGTDAPRDGSPTVDLTLLDILPGDVEGFALIPDGETAAEIVADPATDPGVERLAVGLYVDPSGTELADLAIVNVVGIRAGVLDDAWLRTWRDTYNVAACEISGGLEPGGAEADIGGHQAAIGTCQGGVHTYHVRLSDPDRLIAITSVGSGRFGEQVIAGLTE